MGEVLITLLLVTGTWLLLSAGRRGPTVRDPAGSGWQRVPAWARNRAPGTALLRTLAGVLTRRGAPAAPDPWLMPLLVHQLAALLEAGRSPQVIWAEAARSHAQRTGPGAAEPPSAAVAGSDPDQLVTVLAAADRAAALGHSVAGVLRRYGSADPSGSARNKARQQTTCRIWTDLAACWDVAEMSGAPLSKLLSRYAIQLEAELDAEAARQSALAGPRATVKLLGWLPFFGLGLGLLMGVDPVAILLGTPVGLAALVIGGILIAAGRMWSNKLVTAAGRSS